MKLRFQEHATRAFTRRDLVVVIAILVLLAAVLIPVVMAAHRRVLRIECVDNLKQITLACRDWEGQNDNYYPMQLSVTNGGAREMVTTGDVAHCFQVMSNELISPKYLICPADRKHFQAANWTTDFNNSHISYFLNPDASEAYPQQIMSGDDNLAVNGVPVKSGLLLLPTNAEISWTVERHGHVGNLSFADGSVVEESSPGLRNAAQLSVQGTPITTNRIVIP
jgi:prepilin-type processing-associated H-X9-DG protein